MSKCARHNIFPVEDYRPVYLPFSLLLYFAEFKLYVFHNQRNVEVMSRNIINSIHVWYIIFEEHSKRIFSNNRKVFSP